MIVSVCVFVCVSAAEMQSSEDSTNRTFQPKGLYVSRTALDTHGMAGRSDTASRNHKEKCSFRFANSLSFSFQSGRNNTEFLPVSKKKS